MHPMYDMFFYSYLIFAPPPCHYHSGIEGHTIVRDLFTTHHEQQQRRAGILSGITLSTESARVDAVVNTIG